MARNWIAKELPPLHEVFSSFKGFKPGQSRLRTVIQLVRECSIALQKTDPRPFYSMREVATFFSVPLRTVAMAYETLDLEGLLFRIRGSQTMLAGRSVSSRQSINAIVGLPISLRGMIASPFECSLQMELEERLRLRGFVVDSIFFRTNEECDTTFTDRLLRHKLDMVIWHSPHPLSSHVLMSLRDRGIRLVLFQSSESPLRIPARIHLLEWHQAYRQMAEQWRADGIRRAVFPEPEHLLSRRALRLLKPIVEEHGIEVLIIEATEGSLSSHLLENGRADGEDVLAFLDLQNADALCNGYPDLIEKISLRARLAFCRGPIRIPRFTKQRICVDLVELDPEALAEGVVEDLCDPTQKQEGVRRVLQARYHSQVMMGGTLDL